MGELARALLVAVAPIVVHQIGEGFREWLRTRRETCCEHGRPGGRLCAKCTPFPSLEQEKS